MLTVKYRFVGAARPPQRTTLPVPGWGGLPEPRADGSAEHPWQCVPFSEGARYGFEILYPFRGELRIRKQEGVILREALPPAEDPDAEAPLIAVAGERFYLFPITLDLKPPDGFAIRTEPHPRFYTDLTGTVPVAIPGLIRTAWWPMASTIVFKAPPEGGVHVFREGEPFVQVIVLPEEAPVELVPMDEDLAAERELQARRIEASREHLAEGSRWVSSSNILFDGAYRHMLRTAKTRNRT
jgi:hypothetical protein